MSKFISRLYKSNPLHGMMKTFFHQSENEEYCIQCCFKIHQNIVEAGQTFLREQIQGNQSDESIGINYKRIRGKDEKAEQALHSLAICFGDDDRADHQLNLIETIVLSRAGKSSPNDTQILHVVLRPDIINAILPKIISDPKNNRGRKHCSIDCPVLLFVSFTGITNFLV